MSHLNHRLSVAANTSLAPPLLKGGRLWARPGLLFEKVLRDFPGQAAPVSPLVDHLQQGVQPGLLPQLANQLGSEKGFQSNHDILVSKTNKVRKGGELDGVPVQLLNIENVQEKLERCPGKVLHKDLCLLQTPKELCLHRR